MRTFFRLNSDQQRQDVLLEDHFLSPLGSACWLIGGGPSLAQLPTCEIGQSPIPKMAVNNSGANLIRPTFWTSYDPTARFLRSIYLDAGVMKFVHRRRAMDLAPETSFKVADCPNTVFFERESGRTYSNMLKADSDHVIDWCDSMIQAIDILYRLGFRRVYLAGCEMRIRPTEPQLQAARKRDVVWNEEGTLADFVSACEEKGLTRDELETLSAIPLYHFDETKTLAATIQTDQHYFRISQSLRQSRRTLSQHGMQLISVTPGSRLNEYFPYRDVNTVLAEIHEELGDPRQESTRGLYRQQGRSCHVRGPMRDFRPPNRDGLPRPRVRPETSSRGGQYGPTCEILIEKTGHFSRHFIPPSEEG